MSDFNVLFLTSEMNPYTKSGGLGDVGGALPVELAKKGLNVKVVTPLHSSLDYEKHKLNRIMDNCMVAMGNCVEYYSVHHSNAYGVDVYFIEFQKYFDRKGFYGDKNGEYQDNAFRYTFFCRAAMQVSKDLNFWPSVVHSNDWQTGFVNYAIKRSWDPFWHGVKTIFSIHNLAHQGVFSGEVIPYAGIDMNDWNADGLECYHNINLLKAGIVYADKVNAVSPQYAAEILTPEFGEGLEYYLNKRGWDLVGILNGIDEVQWNPASNKDIMKNYTVKNYKAGKKANKKELQKMFNLDQREDVPIFAMTSRFANQKGINMLAEIIRPMVDNMDMQVVIVGNGEQWAESFFGDLPKSYGGKIGCYIGYSDAMAAKINAGADFFMMPSLYEPCGLAQMYAQKFGTLPVVHGVGGLESTIENYNEEYGIGTGFKFYEPSASAFYNTCAWAVSTYYDRPVHMDNMIKQSMNKDMSWSVQTDEYIRLYNWAMWG